MKASAARKAPLSGIRVVSIEQAVAAPLCSRHLGELGAEVVKVEHPRGGDFARDYDTFVNGFSSHFVWLNRGKKSLAVDLKHPAGLDVMRDLLKTADVLLSNLAPGAFDRLISDSELQALNSQLIRCHITGYGSSGPYTARKAYDALIQGEAGITRNTGTERAPAKAGVSLADLAAGTYACTAINAALFERSHTGGGRRIEIALFDVAVEWMMPILLAEKYAGSAPPPYGAHHATIVPYGPYETSDGTLINIAIQNAGQWRRLCSDVLREPLLAQDHRFDTNEKRLIHRSDLDELITETFRKVATNALVDSLDSADLPWGMLNDAAAVLEHPQLTARNRWVEAELPNGEPFSVLDHPFLTDLPDDTARKVPSLGQHTEELLAAIGYNEQRIRVMRSEAVISP